MGDNSAVILCRVSSKPQGGQDRWSLPSQRVHNEKYAREQGLTLVHEPWELRERSDDAFDRRQFKEILRFVEEHRVANLLVLDSDRLTRGYRAVVDLDDMLQDFLTIHFTESGETINKNTSADRMALWHMKVAFGRYFIKNLKDKARRTYEYRLDQGLYPSNPPLGFNCHKNHLTPNEKEVPFVRRAFELYDSGMESEFTLAEKLYAEGLRTRKGGKVSVTTLSVLLSNPVLVGYVVWPFTESKYVACQHTKGEKIKGQHEAIIDRALFDRVQARLDQKGHPHPTKDKFYIYRGLMKCGVCHRFMSPYTSGGWKYYYSNHPRGGRCEQTQGVREDKADEKFAEALSRFRFPKDLLDWARAMIKAEHEDTSSTVRIERKKLKDAETRIEGELDRAFTKAVGQLDFDAETVRRGVAKLRERKGQIKAQLDALEKDSGRALDDGLTLLELVQDLPKAYKRASDDQRHRMLRMIFNKVVVTGDRFDFKLNEPFSFLYEMRLENPKDWLLGQDSNLQPSG